MSETRLVLGGELAPPAPVPEEGFELFKRVISQIMAGTPDEQWSEEARVTYEQARLNLDRCHTKGINFALELEKVHEKGAAGPGRGVRLKATWIERRDQASRTRYAYPRSYKLEDIMYFLRNHLEHCYLVG